MVDGEEVILSRVNLCKSCSLEKENEKLVGKIDKLEKELLEENKKVTFFSNLNEEHVRQVEELKAQIKRMKCCRNCKHFNQVEIHCDLYAKYECVNHDKWEVME